MWLNFQEKNVPTCWGTKCWLGVSQSIWYGRCISWVDWQNWVEKFQSGRGHGIQNHAKFSSIAVAQPLETCLSSLPEWRKRLIRNFVCNLREEVLHIDPYFGDVTPDKNRWVVNAFGSFSEENVKSVLAKTKPICNLLMNIRIFITNKSLVQLKTTRLLFKFKQY